MEPDKPNTNTNQHTDRSLNDAYEAAAARILARGDVTTIGRTVTTEASDSDTEEVSVGVIKYNNLPELKFDFFDQYSGFVDRHPNNSGRISGPPNGYLPVPRSRRIWLEGVKREYNWMFWGKQYETTNYDVEPMWGKFTDDNGNPTFSYAQAARATPLPQARRARPNQDWLDASHPAVISDPTTDDSDDLLLDQIKYLEQSLRTRPLSRRHHMTLWQHHTAPIADLPPCHTETTINLTPRDKCDGYEQTLVLEQRSGDWAVGVPFNITGYSLLAKTFAAIMDRQDVARRLRYRVSDAHLYTGPMETTQWYIDNEDKLNLYVSYAIDPTEKTTFRSVHDWILENRPPLPDGWEGFDHIPGMLRQLEQNKLNRQSWPAVQVDDAPEFDAVSIFDDIAITNYTPHDTDVDYGLVGL